MRLHIPCGLWIAPNGCMSSNTFNLDALLLNLGPSVKHVRRKWDNRSVVMVAMTGEYSGSLAAQCLLVRQRVEAALRAAGVKVAVDVMCYERIGHGLCHSDLQLGDECLIGARYTVL